MATQADVRRIALALPGTVEDPNRFAFSVRNRDKLRGFVWVWLERIHPKQARVPQPKVVAIRTASLEDKEFLLSLDRERFFTEPHYRNYPAVLVRLERVTVTDLRALLREAWQAQAGKEWLEQEGALKNATRNAASSGTAPSPRRRASAAMRKPQPRRGK